jgi:hypothetical protein
MSKIIFKKYSMTIEIQNKDSKTEVQKIQG